MVDSDYYIKIGMALDLLSRSAFHRRFATGLYLQIEILPPLKYDQMWFLKDDADRAIAMVTWAQLNDEALHDIITTGRSIYNHEWRTGDNIFVNDFISLKVPAIKIVRMLKDQRVFGDNYSCTSFRRHMDASVRKVNRWTNREIYSGGAP